MFCAVFKIQCLLYSKHISIQTRHPHSHVASGINIEQSTLKTSFVLSKYQAYQRISRFST